MSVEVKTYADALSGRSVVSAYLERDFVTAMRDGILRETVDKISDHLAAEFVEKHGPEIAAKLSPEAIANLAIAAGAAQVNETLQKKLPDKIIHHVEERVRTEVYQRGLFGGLKRLR